MLNSFSARGVLVRDAELKYVGANNTPVMEFSIANEGYFGQKHTSFFNCVSFGKRAESVHRFMTKGTSLALEGKMKQERWQDKDGNNRSKVVFVVDDIDLLPRSTKGEHNEPVPEPQTSDDPESDDVPF